MKSFTGVELAMAGMFVTVLMGLVGLITWTLCQRSMRGVQMNRGGRRRPLNSVNCLLCGKDNRVTAQERDKSRVVCRCGQPLFLPQSSSKQLHRAR